ncbi:glycosyltransferase [Prosthecochloris sp. SCSIO W1101]|uniref:glycosyltransferase n=1 Tax=Prosthecochloris sp. SCSIO W1101 TaxID=2992242 RepID=UPI00223E1ED8|nr:glycosyltransferase [Prosthecochloris sp. SCSIO W1101]UZJ41336.1 glycosyltransferase [Prosthecochloris sp. SCSIO W1101]
MNQEHNNPHTAKEEFPSIDCVIIGINSEKTLERCINSILSSDYPRALLHIFYADGGSSDRSTEIARTFTEVTVIELNLEFPTPGIGRNAGWKAGSAPFVQFLDSDTILDPEWLAACLEAMNDDREVGAVRGYRREMHPERSFFNWIGDLEWNVLPGECDSFGGDVMIRRDALELSGGYDEELVGGEDPELSWRIHEAGWKILMLDALMTHHDLAMLKTAQYLRRSYRSGYGFAAVQSRIGATGSSFWKTEQRRIIIKGGGFLAGILAGIAIPAVQPNIAGITVAAFCLAGGTVLLLGPRLFKVGKFMQENRLNRNDAKKYAWHCSLVALPQFFGIVRFYTGRAFNKPLKNRRNKLQTRLSNPTS